MGSTVATSKFKPPKIAIINGIWAHIDALNTVWTNDPRKKPRTMNEKLSAAEKRTYQVLNIVGLTVLFLALALIYFAGLDFYTGMFLAFIGKLMALLSGYGHENEIPIRGIASISRFLNKK